MRKSPLSRYSLWRTFNFWSNQGQGHLSFKRAGKDYRDAKWTNLTLSWRINGLAHPTDTSVNIPLRNQITPSLSSEMDGRGFSSFRHHTILGLVKSHQFWSLNYGKLFPKEQEHQYYLEQEMIDSIHMKRSEQTLNCLGKKRMREVLHKKIDLPFT